MKIRRAICILALALASTSVFADFIEGFTGAFAPDKWIYRPWNSELPGEGGAEFNVDGDSLWIVGPDNGIALGIIEVWFDEIPERITQIWAYPHF